MLDTKRMAKKTCGRNHNTCAEGKTSNGGMYMNIQTGDLFHPSFGMFTWYGSTFGIPTSTSTLANILLHLMLFDLVRVLQAPQKNRLSWLRKPHSLSLLHASPRGSSSNFFGGICTLHGAVPHEPAHSAVNSTSAVSW